MILVDTSVWIDWLRHGATDGARKLNEALRRGIPFGLTGVVYQEVLQGARGTRDFRNLARYLSTQRFFEPSPVETYEEAARLFFRCRTAGVTIRSSVDCLIARVAIEHDLFLLHADADFDRIARLAPELRTY